MESSRNRSKADRREVHSVCMTVPTIILNNPPDRTELPSTLTHSRSAGELDCSLMEDGDSASSAYMNGGQPLSLCVNSRLASKDSRTIDLYCSPRMPRRSVHTDICSYTQQGSIHLDTKEVGNALQPGSRLGSTVSLNSEYTSRSVGLISNDSSSDSHFFHATNVMESSYQKHNLLRRFFSSPEKDEEDMQMAPVRRNSKSWGNLQEGGESMVLFDMGSDSTDDNMKAMEVQTCDTEGPFSKRALEELGCNDEDGEEVNLVTAHTGGMSLRHGRIQKWLTELSDHADDPS